jgi:CobQ/CobB/MinD/ParA nucleotide binding domain.
MRVVSNILTKSDVGTTTCAAKIGGLATEAGLSVLLMELDIQPNLLSIFELDRRAPGIHELLVSQSWRLQQ